MSNFLRIVEVTIGGLNPGAESITVTGLKVVFNVRKTKAADANKCTIKIYNLSKETRDKIENIGDKVILKVGYEGGIVKTIFVGNNGTFSHKISGPEIVTTLEYYDGGSELYDSKIKVEFNKDTEVSKIINSVLGEVKWDVSLPLSRVRFTDKQLTIGYSNMGKVKDILDDLTSMIDVLWFFQDGAVVFKKVDEPLDTNIVFISKDSGMIGIPQKTNKQGIQVRANSRRKGLTKEAPGYIVKTLLNPDIIINNKVSVKSDVLGIDGEYQVDEIEHRGDNYGDDWFTTAKVLI